MNPDIEAHYCSVKRPAAIAHVWETIDEVLNEKPIKVFIQEIPEDRYDDVIDHMFKDFITDEAFFKAFKVNENPEAREEIRVLWKEILKCGWSVGAFVPNPEEDGKSSIVAANILYISTKQSRSSSPTIHTAFKTENISGVIKLIEQFTQDVETHEIFGAEKYITALGLSVDPSFRGIKLSGHLLAARNMIASHFGFRATGNVFTAEAAIKVAKNEGFVSIAKKISKEIMIKDEYLFKDSTTESFQFMGKEF